MSVTIEQPQRVGPGAWRITWSSDLSDPTFYVYRDGRLIATTALTSLVFTIAAGESPVIEVFDDAATLPSTAFPGRVTLAWYAIAAVDHYRIDEYVASVWTQRRRIRDDGSGYFRWRSRFLKDVTSHQFRVVPVGTNGNAGTATSFTVLMVRHPDPPNLTTSYDSGTRQLTFTAA